MNDIDSYWIMDPKCLLCKQEEVNCFYVCDVCHNGLCKPCGEKITDEISELYKNASCEYCTSDLNNFCQSCRDHIDEVIERYNELIKQGIDLSKLGLREKQFTREQIRDHLCMDYCRCDDRCHCYLNATRSIKEKNQIDFYLQEVYDRDICYMPVSKCYDCLNKEGNLDKKHEGWLFIGQKRENPSF